MPPHRADLPGREHLWNIGAMEDDTIAFPDARHRVKVGDLRDWHYVKVMCQRCGHVGLLYPRTLRHRFDPETPISELAPKFRCDNCGKRGSRYWDAWQMSRNT
jgi:predicted RNA-binding Zn-ribbon protein involved in translation (DUF1610 family)